MPTEAPILTKGQTVDGKYEVIRQLGQGGMGAVYEAVHKGTNRRVALKVIVSASLANEAGVIARFQREAKASGSIDSLHVVQVLDTGVEPATGNPYMVMEYLSGEDLSDLVRRLGPLPPDLVIRIGAQACLGLQRAHDAGIIHRDIKSANMFLSRRDGGEVQLKLLDFGIAKVRAEPIPGDENHQLTRTGSMIGSPLYMSPEQARSMKTLDGRSDIWSLGIVLYEALTGRTPNHDKETLGDLLVAICVEPVPELQSRAPWVPPELARIVEKALERDPAHRFATAAEMHAALVAIAPGGTSIREDMLAPLSPELRAHVAPKLNAGMVSAPNVAGSSAPGMQLAAGVTGGDLGASTGTAPKRGRPAYWALAAVPLVPLAVLAAVAIGYRSRTRAEATPDPPIVTTGIVQAPASASAPSIVPLPSGTAAPRVVTVAVVAPAGARAELDGSPVTIRDGTVEISGAPGSLHKLRLVHADASQEADVTILESGAAMPPRVELLVKARAPTKPAGGAPAATAVKTAATASAAAAPAAEPSIKKTF